MMKPRGHLHGFVFEDAAAVAEYIRNMCDLDIAIEKLLQVYQEASDEGTETSTESEAKAATTYLQWLNGRLKTYYHTRHELEFLRTQQQHAASSYAEQDSAA